MQHLTVMMPLVKNCSVTRCAYNNENRCHAKAITVGDGQCPGCDTFLDMPDPSSHAHQPGCRAGVGACKVSSCKFNTDYACMANNISVAIPGNRALCATYAPR
ncbi:MAG: DUF1540 domain-containing protein [Alistipes senegalensis]|nr:DUF1540 domain-containing protein [Oxalobacter formigenes]MCM1281670.1 DUF1540 domain-containing protein [Alistipes senegalensis]